MKCWEECELTTSTARWYVTNVFHVGIRAFAFGPSREQIVNKECFVFFLLAASDMTLLAANKQPRVVLGIYQGEEQPAC